MELLQQAKEDQYDTMKKHQKMYEDKSTQNLPKINYTDREISTDLSFLNPNSHSLNTNSDLKIEENPENPEDLENDQNPENLKNGQNSESRHRLNLDYLYGSKAFEAIQKLSKAQVMEYLPLTDIEVEDENDPEWFADYKKFLQYNNLEADSHRRNYNNSYDLTQDLEDAKNSEWYSKQKFRLVRQLRKHQQRKSELSGVSETGMILEDSPSQGHQETDLEQTGDFYQNNDLVETQEVKRKQKVDTGVVTDPDIMFLLAELKNDEENGNLGLESPIRRNRPDKIVNAYKTIDQYNSPEDDTTRVSMTGSKNSMITEKYKRHSLERIPKK